MPGFDCQPATSRIGRVMGCYTTTEQCSLLMLLPPPRARHCSVQWHGLMNEITVWIPTVKPQRQREVQTHMTENSLHRAILFATTTPPLVLPNLPYRMFSTYTTLIETGLLGGTRALSSKLLRAQLETKREKMALGSKPVQRGVQARTQRLRFCPLCAATPPGPFFLPASTAPPPPPLCADSTLAISTSTFALATGAEGDAATLTGAEAAADSND